MPSEIQIERIWAMPNKWTFTIKPVRQLLQRHVSGTNWIDPFAGENSPAQITNDLNPERKAIYHLDALEFLKLQPDSFANGILYDPPYSITQAKQCYDSFGKDKLDTSVSSMAYWSKCKDEVKRILLPGGKAICFGWNTMGLGKNRGFTMEEILIIPHGGSKNDTLVTVEVKI